jgi:hypothetical protein
MESIETVYSVVHGVQRYDMGKFDGVSRRMGTSATGVATGYGWRQRSDPVWLCCGQLGLSL